MDVDPGMFARPRRHRGHSRTRTFLAAAVLAGTVAAAACQHAPTQPDAVASSSAVPAAPKPSPVPTDPLPVPPPAQGTTPPQTTLPSTTTPPTLPQTCVTDGVCYGPPELLGTFDVASVPEASGLAASRRNPGVLWLLDDGPGTTEVWALGPDGGLLGAVTVAGLDGRDTEALAVGPCGREGAETCVYVGDIGDNLRQRPHVTVHRFVEPDLTGGIPAAPVEAEAVDLAYPDGPHDAEALLADEQGGLLVVTKAPFNRETGLAGQARVYGTDRFAGGVLVDHGPLEMPEPTRPLHSLLVGDVVTGGDALPGRVLLRTYDRVLLYLAPDEGAPLHTFPSWPVHEVPSALEPQSEAVAWAPDGCGYLTAGEQAGEVWSVPCR